MTTNSTSLQGKPRPGLLNYLGNTDTDTDEHHNKSGKNGSVGSHKKIRHFVDTDDSSIPVVKPPARPTRKESMAANNHTLVNNNNNNNNNNDDDDDDDDVKRRIKASQGTSTATAQLEALDREINAKNQARRSIILGVTKKPPAKLTVADDEGAKKPTAADITAKDRARSAAGPAMIPGAVSVDDDDDDAIMPSKPTTTNNNSDDDDAKNRARSQNGPRFIVGAIEERNDTGDKKVAAYAALPRRIENNLDDDDDYQELFATSGEDDKLSFVRNLEAAAAASLEDPLAEDSKRAPAEDNIPGLFSDGRSGGELSNMLVHEFYREDVEAGQLAVAKPVVEEEQDSYIPAAVEFDPDSKPPLYKNRRFRYYSGISLVFGIAALVLAVVFTQKASENEYSGPTLAPTTFRESLGIQDQIIQKIGSAKLEDENSPHSKALRWLLHDDPMQLSPDAPNLLQRYILALFYFQTSTKGSWRSCNPPQENESAECLYESIVSIFPTLVFEPVPEIRWLSDHHECDWVGVLCSTERVVTVSIRGQMLTGTFPEDLAYLPFLRDLSLAVNDLTGTIPATLAKEMRQLQDIELHINSFTGTIPPELFMFDNLQRVNLGENMLTGELVIPTDSSLTLQNLFLYENNLVGTIPTELGLLTNLRYLRVSKTLFTGPLPTEIGRLKYLQEMWVQQTSLSGTIPSEIGQMNDLWDFRISNTFTTGTIPEELYETKDLFRIDISSSNITGTISTAIGQLSSLELFRARETKLNGQIPTELNLLTLLRQMQIELTDLTGTIPDGLCELRADSILLELIANCLIPDGMDSAPVTCAAGCCTACCNQKTATCVSYET